MADFITSKVDGDTVAASEWNQLASVDNLITTSGQTPSTSNLNQMGIGAARYASGGQFFTDSGIADAYVLSPVSPFKAPVSATEGYFNGMTIRFRAGNAGTGGAATVNVNGAGVKSLKEADGTTNPASIPTTEDSMYRYDGTVFRKVNLVVAATESTAGISKLPKQITISNGTDSDHDIDFTAGNFKFNDGSGTAYFSAQTGAIDALFGTGTGMLDTGTVGDAPYYLFPVYNPTTGDAKPLASLSKTSPTMTLPNASGYTILGKKIASCHTDGSFNIRNGTWTFNPDGSSEFDYKTEFEEFEDFSTGTSAVLKTITAPADTFVKGIISLFDDSVSGSTPILLLTSPSQTNSVPTASLYTLKMVAISGTGENNYEQTFIIKKLDSSSQLRYRLTVSAADISVQFINYGWIDNNL